MEITNEEEEENFEIQIGILHFISSVNSNYLSFSSCCRSCRPGCNELLEQVSDLQSNDSLEETSSIVASGEILVLQHLLSDFTVELG